MKIGTLMCLTGAAAFCLAGSLMAQNTGGQGGGGAGGGQGRGGPGGRNFDPAQMQQRMMDNMKEQLEITDEAEWKAVQPLVQKVMDARRASMSGMARGMMGGMRRGGPQGGGDNAPAADQQNRRGGMFGQPSPEAEALQKVIDAKAPKAELKAAVAKYNEARKAKQAELEQAQEALRKVLTARQEALATLNGTL